MNLDLPLLGAIAGDMIGSVWEGRVVPDAAFPHLPDGATFTDDSVLTVATAAALLGDGDYAAAYRDFGNRYPHRGYGGGFQAWLLSSDAGPYGSFGNGSAMRVSPVGFAMDSVKTVLAEAKRSAAVTHDHPEGIKGAQATALAVYLARTGAGKDAIREEISGRFGYAMDRTVESIRPTYRPDVTCQGSVPEAIICFLDSTGWEDAIRNAISLGGDADTQAAIAGAVAEAYYGGVPVEIASEVVARVPEEFMEVLACFRERWG